MKIIIILIIIIAVNNHVKKLTDLHVLQSTGNIVNSQLYQTELIVIPTFSILEDFRGSESENLIRPLAASMAKVHATMVLAGRLRRQ